jgi:predicted dehydrogenase
MEALPMSAPHLTRREALAAGVLPLSLAAAAADEPRKPLRIGVVSASIGGKAQKTNGHTWHFAQYLHPTINLDAIKKYLDPGSVRMFHDYLRNPRYNFDVLPFADTRITHVYDADAAAAAMYAEAFPGVKVARKLEELVDNVDAVWMGDASGRGEDHHDLVAPGLEKGLPTFCDKPIGGSVASTRKILDLAKKHKTPIMSSSLFRHQLGTEHALHLRDKKEDGELQFVLASMAGGYTPEGWFIYGQHPAWTVMTVCGPGVEAVNLYARNNTAHGFVTYPDRMPAEIWYGRPDMGGFYCEASAYFTKRVYRWTPAIEGDFWWGHHYSMFRMADTFRRMVHSRTEPVPHREILEVTAIIHAGARSLKEKGRLVTLAEVMA